MPVATRRAAPREAAALLEASHALMRSLFPAEANHFLDIDALAAPHIRFLVAEEAGALLGCAALRISPEYGEVKSMFVAPEARGKGAGAALLAALEAEAKAVGLPAMRLETGTGLDAAHRLYSAAGFTECGPFGDYEESPFSLFMEKLLPAPPVRRAGPGEDWAAVRALVAEAFAYMEGRIDPPSSLHRWTAETFAAEAASGAAFLAEAAGRPVACLFAQPEGDAFYIGKVAVAKAWRGRGLARALVEAAEAEARALGLASLALGSRIELAETHAAFAALGFERTGESAHPGFDRPTSIAMARPLNRPPLALT